MLIWVSKMGSNYEVGMMLVVVVVSGDMEERGWKIV